MAFDPKIDLDRLQPLLNALEWSRQELNSIDVPTMLGEWLQRFTEARGSHMSTRIEGNPLSEAEVREVLASPDRGTDAAQLENRNYRDAVRFARQFADDPSADIDGGFIRALHFTIVREVDRYGSAGRYRFEQNVVRDRARVVYMPPPPTEVSRLMDDLVEWLRASRGSVHPLVLAAVAHIEIINVHPFDDGNGRTARALTAHFLARGGWRLRDFISVEQVFGDVVEDYYRELRQLGDRYPGQRPTLTRWAAWFLVGLYAEIGTQTVAARTWLDRRESPVAADHPGMSNRLSDGIAFIVLNSVVTNRQYRDAFDVSAATAASDLKLLASMGLVRREGGGRSTRYVSLFQPLDEHAPTARQNLRDEIVKLAGLADLLAP